MWCYVLIMCLIPFTNHHGISLVADGNATRSGSHGTLSGSHGTRSGSHGTLSGSHGTLSGSYGIQHWNSGSSAVYDRFNKSSLNSTGVDGQNHTSILTAISTNQKIERKFYNPQKEWTVFMLFFNAALPLVFTALCYVYVIVRLRTVIDVVPMITEQKLDHSGKDQEVAEQSTTLIKENRRYKHVTIMALALCSLYFVLWGPSIFYYTIHSVAGHFFICNWDNSKSEQFLVYFIKYLSFLCCLVSPVIYCYRHPKVRKLIRKATQRSTYRSGQTYETGL